MGGKKVIAFIEKYAPDACRRIDMKSMRGKIIVFDTSQVLHKYGRSKRKGEGSFFYTPDGKDISHILAILNSTINYTYDIIPVHVFDGPSPSIKRTTVDDRIRKTESAEKELNLLLEKEKNMELSEEEINKKIQLRSRSFKLTREKIDECCQLLSIMGLPHMIAYEEADPQCSMLQRYKDLNVYGVAGEDTDLLAYGCEIVLRNFGTQNATSIDLNIILKQLELSYDEFVDIFIFSGVDYFEEKRHIKGISGIGIEKAYKIMKKIKSLSEKINLELMDINGKLLSDLSDEDRLYVTRDSTYHNIIKILNYIIKYEPSLKIPERYFQELIKIKDRYTKTSLGKDPKDFNIEWKTPNLEKFKNLLLEKYNMTESTVNSYSTKLLKKFKRYIQPVRISSPNRFKSFESCSVKQRRVGRRKRNDNSWGNMPASFSSYQQNILEKYDKKVVIKTS